MIISRPKFIADWSARKEALDSGATKVLRTLAELRDSVPELDQWCCNPPPLVPIPLTGDSITKAIREKSRNRDRFPELGWTFAGWTEPNDRPFSLTMFFGVTGRLLGNRILLDFPPGFPLEHTLVRRVLSTLVNVWEPEYAAYNPVHRKDEKRFLLGEETFLSTETEKFLGDISSLELVREPMEG